MPTGYTACIEDDATFNEFVMGCARAFGALITMRDDPPDAQIPEEFKPSNYHQNEAENKRKEIANVKEMTNEQIRSITKKKYDDACAYRNQRLLDIEKLRAKYDRMLSRVKAWVPPSPDHIELKNFMIQQLEETIKQDCVWMMEYYTNDVPKLIPIAQWRRTEIARLEESIVYNEENQRKENERVASRNKWVKDLRDSLKGTV